MTCVAPQLISERLWAQIRWSRRGDLVAKRVYPPFYWASELEKRRKKKRKEKKRKEKGEIGEKPPRLQIS